MTNLAIRCHLEVDTVVAQHLWGIFRPGMQRIEKNAPFKHGLRQEEFSFMMIDTSFKKYVLYEREVVVGLGLVATDINKVDWLSYDYFRNVYGDAPVHYLIGVTLQEDFERGSDLGGRALVTAALEDLPADGTFIYDFSCSIHSSLSSFGQMLKKDAGRVRMVDAVEFWEIKHSYSQARGQSAIERRRAK
jgi:hypothetical protein